MTIQVHFAPAASPPAGRISAHQIPDRPFVGWTELFSGLETALADLQTIHPTQGDPSSSANERGFARRTSWPRSSGVRG